jgi:hypothetical protein
MMQKIALISFILIFIYLYLYVKLESFDGSTITTIPQNTNPLPTFAIPTIKPDLPISNQLSSEIARVLRISKRRISNLIFKGDISSGKLQVMFNILDPNAAEIANNESMSKDVAMLAHTLTLNNNFKVLINGISVMLDKIQTSNKDINKFFDNTNLLDITDYSNSKYISVPNDESLTKFYKLNIDKNFNIVPSI